MSQSLVSYTAGGKRGWGWAVAAHPKLLAEGCCFMGRSRTVGCTAGGEVGWAGTRLCACLRRSDFISKIYAVAYLILTN
jgi:hypothetical protein